MPPEGAKWVKNPQNQKKPEKSAYGSRQKNSQKSTKNKKGSFPKGFCSEEDHLSLGRKLDFKKNNFFVYSRSKFFFLFFRKISQKSHFLEYLNRLIT